MSSAENKRWPHIFSVYNQALDSRGRPVTDEDGNPVNTAMSLEMVVYSSGYRPKRKADGSFLTKTVTEVPWGYRTSTGGIKDSGEVFQTDFKISCPMLFTDLPEGTVLRLTDYTHTFNAIVKKCTTYNWGTNIWFDNPGNNGEVPAAE